mgnify:FL=1|jgi:hypothetical protein
MEKINFQNDVTKLNKETFDTFQDNIDSAINNNIEHKYQLKIISAITAGTEVTIPCYYKVGQAVLDVYLNGERLSLSSDASGTDGHYQEVGIADSISNKIKTTTDWSLEVDDVLDFVVRGDYSATV